MLGGNFKGTLTGTFYSSGFGGHAQDNANAKMLSSITEIEIRNFSAPFGERVRHVHSDNGQQTSTLTSGDNVDNTNLRVSVGSTEQPPTVTRDSKNKQANCEESEEDTLSSHTTARDEERQIEAEEIEEPQYSSDSFETLTMGLPEITSDKYTMPAIPSKKVSGNDACKLRRGKGLRDFQKDILPGLASLSRHEIREDFHNIEHALRKSRSRNRENWPIPVRSQRSRRFTANRRQP
ncbi:hypothetical protein J5N97_029891 [Dioscorea zingiberensis]|uniref:Uncharacterized protein n=1 Tax=Dioscorea zingiberensis TaxID=325984 RepID=A0A9D5BWN5_9LILI|nr:hypothetical protein J5N97_029891 [Dioscorea zingiberensis]